MAFLLIADRGDILTVTFNRPQVRNAISREVLAEFNARLDAIETDARLRGVIFTGAGEAFCAGADLKERSGMSDEETLAFVGLIQSTFDRISKLPVPTIAAVQGFAFGGGLELALAADIRVVEEGALLGLTECSLGIIPGAGGTQRLLHIAGYSRAIDLILGARRFDAGEGYRLGLVDRLAPKGQALAVAEQVMAGIAKNAPLAVRAAKKAIAATPQEGIDVGLKRELLAYQEILYTKDRREGFTAFMEKRPPQFVGE